MAIRTGIVAASVGTVPSEFQGPTQGPLSSIKDERACTKVPDRYALTPEKQAKAVAYSRATYTVYFVGVALSVAIYLLIWRVGLAVRFRNWAHAVSARHFIQCLIFVPLLLAVARLLRFPLVYYSGFVLEHRFDLSSQTFASWVSDWTKNFGIAAAVGVVAVWIFYWVVRRSPRRWWFYFWLATIPLALAVMVIEPFVIDPLFFKYTRLQETEPELTARIELMLRRAGLDIPPSRIFEMSASPKTKALNAYVSGLGPSKRVVIWDNTLRKMSGDETLLVVGHETGHYVLHHISKEFVLIELVVLGFFYLGSRILARTVQGAGARTRIESLGDLASLPVVLGILTVLAFLSSPIVSAISRHFEHQADQFGLEVAWGVVPDPNSAEVRSLQILGEEDLEDPDPSSFIRFWLYTHPPLDERIRFAAHYRPWTERKPLKFTHRR